MNNSAESYVINKPRFSDEMLIIAISHLPEVGNSTSLRVKAGGEGNPKHPYELLQEYSIDAVMWVLSIVAKMNNTIVVFRNHNSDVNRFVSPEGKELIYLINQNNL